MTKEELAFKAAEAVRDAAPPMTYVGMTVYGVPLPDIVSIATLVYLAVQVGYITYKWREGK